MIGIELRHLRSFVCLAEELHFARAATRLHIVQPALSAQIKTMEAMLEVRLFERGRHKVTLTEAGALLLPEARATLAQADHGIEVVRRAARGELGRLRLGYTGASAYSGLLARLVGAFHRRSPDVELSFEELFPAAQHDALRTGRIDVGLSPLLSGMQDAECAHHVVETWPFVLAMPEKHPLATRQTITPGQIAGEALIVYSGSDGDMGAALRARLRIEPSSMRQVTTVPLLLALVGAGLGVAVVPAGLANHVHQSVVFRPMALGDLRIRIAATHLKCAVSATTHAFIDTILAEP